MVQRTWIQVPRDWPSGSAVGQEPDRVLHHVSAERQVIIFSHDSQVLAWAQEALSSPRDKIIELAAVTPA